MPPLVCLISCLWRNYPSGHPGVAPLHQLYIKVLRDGATQNTSQTKVIMYLPAVHHLSLVVLAETDSLHTTLFTSTPHSLNNHNVTKIQTVMQLLMKPDHLHDLIQPLNGRLHTRSLPLSHPRGRGPDPGAFFIPYVRFQPPASPPAPVPDPAPPPAPFPYPCFCP